MRKFVIPAVALWAGLASTQSSAMEGRTFLKCVLTKKESPNLRYNPTIFRIGDNAWHEWDPDGAYWGDRCKQVGSIRDGADRGQARVGCSFTPLYFEVFGFSGSITGKIHIDRRTGAITGGATMDGEPDLVDEGSCAPTTDPAKSLPPVKF